MGVGVDEDDVVVPHSQGVLDDSTANIEEVESLDVDEKVAFRTLEDVLKEIVLEFASLDNKDDDCWAVIVMV